VKLEGMDGNNVVLAGSGSCEHDDGQQQFSKRQKNHRREPGEATQGACFIKTMVDSNLPLDPDCWMVTLSNCSMSVGLFAHCCKAYHHGSLVTREGCGV